MQANKAPSAHRKVPRMVFSSVVGLPLCSLLCLLSISEARDACTPHFVIPAKAGIHWFLKVKMDPRFRGDDVNGDESLNGDVSLTDDVSLNFGRCPSVGNCHSIWQSSIGGQSTLAPDCFTIFAYLAISLLINAANCSGESAAGSAPCCAKKAFISAEARILVTSAFHLATISLGVPAGAMKPHQV